MWSYAIHDTREGTLIDIVRPATVSWTRRLNGRGTGSASFVLSDPGVLIEPQSTLRAVFDDNRRTFVVKWGEGPGAHVAYAGVITDSDYDKDTQTLTVNFTEIRMLFGKRHTGGVNQYGSFWNLTITGKSPAGAVRAILDKGLTPSSNWALPIDLPADGAGSVSMKVDYFAVRSIEDLIAEVEGRGFQVDFRPYLTAAGLLRWEARVLSDTAYEGVTDLPVSPRESSVTGLKVKKNGAKRVTGILAIGEGRGEVMLSAWAGTGGGVIPIRDERRDAKKVKTLDALQAFADAELAKWQNSVEQWSFAVQLGDAIEPDALQPARLLRMDVRGDVWLPDAVYTMRVVALAGGTGLSVTPEVQSVG